MNVSSSQRTSKKPSQPHPGPRPKPWKFDRKLRAILHGDKSCKVCVTWCRHFVNALNDKKESLSITTARNALDSASRVQKEIYEAQQRKDEVFEVVAGLRRKLDMVRSDLGNVLQGNDTAMYANKYLNSES